MILFFLLHIITLKPNKIFRINAGTSMFMPAVDETGTSPKYGFFGDYVITTFSSDLTSIKLGYDGTPSYAGMLFKEALQNRPFRVNIRLSIAKMTQSDGIGIWLTEDNNFEKGEIYGRKPSKGILIAIDLKQKPFMGLSFNAHENGKNFYKTAELGHDIFHNQQIIRIENDQDEITISRGRGDKFRTVFSIKNYPLPKELFLGISTQNSTGFSDVRIFAIRHTNIEYPTFATTSDEKKHSTKYVWIIFFIGIVVLGVFLSREQLSKFRKKV